MDIKNILKQNEKPVPHAKHNEFQMIVNKIESQKRSSIFSFPIVVSGVAAVLIAIVGFQFQEKPITDDELADFMEDTYTYFDADSVAGSEYLSMIE